MALAYLDAREARIAMKLCELPGANLRTVPDRARRKQIANGI